MRKAGIRRASPGFFHPLGLVLLPVIEMQHREYRTSGWIFRTVLHNALGQSDRTPHEESSWWHRRGRPLEPEHKRGSAKADSIVFDISARACGSAFGTVWWLGRRNCRWPYVFPLNPFSCRFSWSVLLLTPLETRPSHSRILMISATLLLGTSLRSLEAQGHVEVGWLSLRLLDLGSWNRSGEPFWSCNPKCIVGSFFPESSVSRQILSLIIRASHRQVVGKKGRNKRVARWVAVILSFSLSFMSPPPFFRL